MKEKMAVISHLFAQIIFSICKPEIPSSITK